MKSQLFLAISTSVLCCTMSASVAAQEDLQDGSPLPERQETHQTEPADGGGASSLPPIGLQSAARLARPGRSLTLPTAVFLSAAAADLTTTFRNLSCGPNCVGTEHNTLLAFTHNRPVPTVLAGAAADAAFVWVMHRVGRKHPSVVRVVLFVAAGASGAVAVGNAQNWREPAP